MRDAQWKAIAAIVESTRGRCGGPRTDLRRTVDGSLTPAMIDARKELVVARSSSTWRSSVRAFASDRCRVGDRLARLRRGCLVGRGDGRLGRHGARDARAPPTARDRG
jgi:hypothetical protein